jgi:hypothetical protein
MHCESRRTNQIAHWMMTNKTIVVESDKLLLLVLLLVWQAWVTVSEAQPLSPAEASHSPQTVSGSTTPEWRWQQQGSSAALSTGDVVLWKFNYGNDYGKPFFHPLATADGRVLTNNAPQDHPWHHGLWFSWKYINGVNYWENNGVTGKPDGTTTWSDVDVETHHDYSARITMALEYRGPTDDKPLLTEQRSMDISPPQRDGGYTIDWASDFTAAKRVKLDRSPFTPESAGGYAGLSVRFAAAMEDRQAVARGGPLEFNRGNRYRGHQVAVDYSGRVDGELVGLAFLDHPENVRHPTAWYLLRHPAIGYMNAAVLHDDALVLDAGQTLFLRYRLVVHRDRWSPEQLQAVYRRYEQNGSRSIDTENEK